MHRYEIVATLLVVAIPVTAIALARIVLVWARTAIARGRVVGRIGVLCTLAAAANLLVVRTCDGDVNRPLFMLVHSTGDCYQSAVAALELVLLLAVTTSVVVRVNDLRR